MRRSRTTAFFGFTMLLGQAVAQVEEASQTELKARLDRKLESPWLDHVPWQTDLDEALALAQSRDTRIFAFFSRSYIDCPRCASLETGVLLSPGFVKWVESFVPYVHISTHLNDRKDEGLFRTLHVEQYPPQVAFLDEEGQVIARPEGDLTLEAFQTMDSSASAYEALRAKARQGDVAASQQVFLRDLALRNYSHTEGALALEAMQGSMPESMRAEARQALIDIEFQERRRELQAQFEAGISSEEYERRELALYMELFDADKAPSGVNGIVMGALVKREAQKAKDTDRFDRAHALYERRLLELREPPSSRIEERTPDAVNAFAETIPGPLEDALQEAADFLVTQQVPSTPNQDPSEWHYDTSPSGDYGDEISNRVATTAIVCEALVLAPGFENKEDHRQSVERAISFMIRELSETPTLQPTSGEHSQSWAQAYALQFLLRALQLGTLSEETTVRVRAIIPHLIQCLTENESGWPAGGWNYVNIEACSPFMTGATLLVLFQARGQGFAVDPEAIDMALKGLANTRIETGSYLYSGGDTPADTDRAFAPEFATWAGACARASVAELALYRAGRSNLRQLRMAVDAFFDHWGELMKHKDRAGKHAAPHGVAPYYFMFGHTYAAKAIEALPEDVRPALRQKMQQALWHTREANGSWTERDDPKCSAYATAMAMQALMAPRMEAVPEWRGR